MIQSDKYIKYVKTIPLTQFTDNITENRYEEFFLPEELDLYSKEATPRSLAARWLIKKIVTEHFGEKLSYLQISVTGDKNGKPKLSIQNKNITQQVFISISHSRNYITAMVLIEKE